MKTLNAILDGCDNLLNYVGVQLLKLPTFKIFNIIITPKTQTALVFIAGFLLGTIWISNTFAHGGHGDEEAQKLGSNTSGVLVSGPQFTSPVEVESSSIGVQSYPGIIISDEYGSIYSSREGIVSQLFVTLGDRVKKGQKVAIISSAGNTPEIISLIANQKAGIAIAQGQLNGAKKVVEYLSSNIQTGTSVDLQTLYNQQKEAIDIGIETQKQQLELKIGSIKKQLQAKGQLVEANKLANQASIQGNESKIQGQQQELIASIDRAISTLASVFLDGNLTSFQNGSSNTFQKSYWSALNTTEKTKLESYLSQLASQYPIKVNSYSDIIILSELVEQAVKQGISVLSYTVTSNDYSPDHLDDDKQMLINLYGGNGDTGIAGISFIKAKAKQLEKEVLGGNLIASGNILVANADLLSFQQEIDLLQNQIKLLEADKKKQVAEIDGEQGIKSFEVGFEYKKQALDLEKILIEAKKDVIIGESSVSAYQNALSAVQSTAKTTHVVAPFDGIIARKNVSIGQNIELSTALFDIAGNSSKSKAFVRFEIPVSEFRKVKIGQALQTSLPGSQEFTIGVISRIAGSVNKENQTITIEGNFSENAPYPLGTILRVSAQSLSGAKVLEIPSFAVGQDEDGTTWIYKVLPNKTLKKRNITISYTDGEKSYINNGLKASDTIVSVIVGGNWSDGMDVAHLLDNTNK